MYVYRAYVSETMTGRLNFRVPEEAERALRRAAALSGQTLSGFVLSSATEHAYEVLQRERSIALSERAFTDFVGALEGAAETSPEMARLLDRQTRIPLA